MSSSAPYSIRRKIQFIARAALEIVLMLDQNKSETWPGIDAGRRINT
jgi:hypothetical protein